MISEIGRVLLVVGGVCIALGLVLTLGARIPGASWIGHLPGDLTFERPGFKVYAPLGTCLLASVILTVLVHLLRR